MDHYLQKKTTIQYMYRLITIFTNICHFTTGATSTGIVEVASKSTHSI